MNKRLTTKRLAILLCAWLALPAGSATPPMQSTSNPLLCASISSTISSNDDKPQALSEDIDALILQHHLSSPAIVTGNNGIARYMYAGDLQGNLWRIDLKDGITWKTEADAPVPKKIFTTKVKEENPQPITTRPEIVFAPDGGYVILFGTGKLTETADTVPANFKTQSFYAVHDTLYDKEEPIDRSHLAERTLSPSSSAGASAGKKGWYIDLPDSDKTGERIVTDPVVAYDRIYFNSLIPGSDVCSKRSGRTYIFNTLSGMSFNGGVTNTWHTTGPIGSLKMIETAPMETSTRDATGRRTVKREYTVTHTGTNDTQNNATTPAWESHGVSVLQAGRLSWREILNWQELRNATSNTSSKN